MSFKSVLFNNNQSKKLLYKNLLRLNFFRMINFMATNILRLDAVYSMWWNIYYSGHFDIHGNMLESSANNNKRCIICNCKKYYKYVSHKFRNTPNIRITDLSFFIDVFLGSTLIHVLGYVLSDIELVGSLLIAVVTWHTTHKIYCLLISGI